MTSDRVADVTYEQKILTIMSNLKETEKEVKEKPKTRGKRTSHANSQSRKRPKQELKKTEQKLITEEKFNPELFFKCKSRISEFIK